VGTKYTTQAASGYNASPPPDDGTQVASNLVTYAGVKTKLADPIKTLADAENTALVSALDLSARAISTPDTAVASDHWRTLQVTGTTAITLSSAASMGAGYEVGIFNAGVGVVTVTPGGASDTINGVSASVTVSIKGTKIFRTNQALTGYNVVGGYDPQTVTATTSVVTPLVQAATGAALSFGANASAVDWQISTSRHLLPASDNALNIGGTANRIANVFTSSVDTGIAGSGALKTNNGSTQVTWDNNGAIAIGGRASPASGAGVAFPAAQSASTDVNTLDDYEEGTWTPGVAFGGGIVGITYGTQAGNYTKIGNMVTAWFTMALTNKGSSTGSATLTGLPFTINNSSGSSGVEAASWTGMTTSLILTQVQGIANTTTANIFGLAAAATSSQTNLANTDFANTTNLVGKVVFRV